MTSWQNVVYLIHLIHIIHWYKKMASLVRALKMLNSGEFRYNFDMCLNKVLDVRLRQVSYTSCL